MQRSTKTALGLAIIVLLAAAGLYVYVYQLVKDTNESVLRILQEIEAESQKEEVVLELKRLYEDTQDLRGDFTDLLIREADIVSFLSQLEAVGATAGTAFEITEVRLTGSSATEDNRQVLEVRFQARGSFQEVYHLQQLVEAMPYEVILPRVAYTYASEAETAAWQGNFTLQVLSYVAE